MAIFVSAGHHRRDPGAVHKGKKESEIAMKLRDKTVSFIRQLRPDIKVITDDDDETLGQYLRRIKPGNGSVVLEYHLNAGPVNRAQGVEVLVRKGPSQNELDFANDLADNANKVGIPYRNRRVITEDQSHRGRLALMRLPGIVALKEVGFITSDTDMEIINDEEKMNRLCLANACTLIKYDDLIK